MVWYVFQHKNIEDILTLRRTVVLGLVFRGRLCNVTALMAPNKRIVLLI